MSSKENDIFYLKLQWISAKDEAERKKLADKIRQLLAEHSKAANK
jgi:type I restriction-modification system DNA methylase subunit